MSAEQLEQHEQLQAESAYAQSPRELEGLSEKALARAYEPGHVHV